MTFYCLLLGVSVRHYHKKILLRSIVSQVRTHYRKKRGNRKESLFFFLANACKVFGTLDSIIVLHERVFDANTIYAMQVACIMHWI